MKYSNWIGIALIGLLFWACTQVWASVPSGGAEVGGLSYKINDRYGRPGMMHIILGIPAIIMFLIPRLWAKRTNVFITGINMAWGLRNFYLFGIACEGGICPDRHAAVYIVFAASILIMVMALFPRVEIKLKN
jgi:hypothetical protein